MTRKMRISTSMACKALSIALLVAVVSVAPIARAQAPARFLGTVTAINGTTLTLKTDAGQIYQVQVPVGAAIKRIAPGQKDLSTAEAIQFSDLAVGDRALVKLDPDAPAGTSQALQIVAIKQSDVAEKQRKDREDWQRNGVGGLVKSVDAAGGVIVLTSGSGATAKTIIVNTTKATVLKRYATASVSYDAAQPAPIDTVHAGDQLRARGTRNGDGTSIDAAEVVSGTFRNISGTILSVDTAGSALVLKDLATKKQVTIHITADAQMRRLPDRMAAMLAARLKGTSGGAGGGFAGAGQSGGGAGSFSASSAGPGSASPSPGSPSPAGPSPAGPGSANASPGTAPRGGSGQWNGSNGQAGGAPAGGQGVGQFGGGGQGSGGAGGGDPQQMLSRAPAIQIADLKKGDAVMLVSTDGSTDVTAITLLAGVEPLLEAPAASQSLLNNWSMGSGAGGAADAAAQ